MKTRTNKEQLKTIVRTFAVVVFRRLSFEMENYGQFFRAIYGQFNFNH
jgi:hypothetical protein